MKIHAPIAALCALLALAGCKKHTSGSFPPVTAPPSPMIVKPTHYYDLKEGSVYSYLVGTSEQEARKGWLVREYMRFKYLGKHDGKDVVVSVDNHGRVVSTFRCSRPCVAIKTDGSEDIAFDRRSVVGIVLDDVANGRIEIAGHS